jgi:hypothetical protein
MSILNGASALAGSVVDPEPDPVGSEVLAGSGSRKHHSRSEQLLIRNEFEVKLWYSGKLIKIFHFCNKNAQLKNLDSFS